MNKKGGQVCGYFNPYFKADCRLGYYCKFTHLNETEYIEYCNSWNLITPMATDAYNKSLTYFNRCQYRLSLAILKKLLIDYPVNAMFHALIVKCFEKLRMEEAYYHHRKLIAIHPKDPMYHANYAMYLYRKMKPPQISAAKQHFMTAIDLIKDTTYTTSAALIHGYIAKFLFETENNIEKAQYHYKIALDLNDNVDPRCYYNYAVLLHAMGNLKDSEYHFKKSISDGSQQPFFWHHFNYALLLKQREKYKESENQMLKCMEIRPKYAMISFEYGLLLCECMENYDLGLFYLNQACNLKIRDKTHYIQIYNYYKNTADTLKSFENEGIISNKQNQIEQNQPNEPNQINQQNVSYDSYQWEWDQNQQFQQNQQNSQIQQNEDNEWKYDERDGFRNIYNENKNDNKDEQKSKSETISRSEISMTSSAASCSNEFERFLSTKVFIDRNKAHEYYNKFAKLSLNDIRLISHFDQETLKNDIGINNKIHIKMFLEKVNKFKKNEITFQAWLKDIGMTEYEDILSGVGILTFDSLYHYVHNFNDLLPIIGEHNKSDAQLIWNSTPKMSRNSTLF